MKSDLRLEDKKKYYKELKESNFLVPCQRDGGIGVVSVNKEKESYIVAFSSEEELKKTNSRDFEMKEIVNYSFDQLIGFFTEMFPKINGIVINPFTNAVFINSNMISEICSVIDGITFKRNDHVIPQSLYPFPNISKDLKLAIHNFCRDEVNIEKMWIVLAGSKIEPLHIQFIFQFIGDRKILFPKVAEIISKHMKPGESFELVQADEELANKANKISQPIYLKEGVK